ncbi:MAG: carbon storage regulator [Planctomycetota bacterium]|jgi:carbon storage regulator|nr:MAG: carbon storage regulator [Planctomycetota bacterium]
MLVLTRKKAESIVVFRSDGEDSGIRIVVLEISKGIVKLGIEAPPDVSIHRMEVWERIKESRAALKAS